MQASKSDTATASKMVVRAYPEPGKPLGRHVHHDRRSRDYPARRAGSIRNVRHAAHGLPLKQDDAHICSTAHSLCAALNCAGGTARRRLTESDAVRVFETATRLEPMTDRNGPVAGSSGLMACKAARKLGLIKSYEHAFGVQHALEALMLRPVMTGINWYTSFDAPDPRSGLAEIAPDATVRGGHEVLADEIDADAGVVWFWNSWGRGYGLGGRFCMTIETWSRLLDELGDVTVPVT